MAIGKLNLLFLVLTSSLLLDSASAQPLQGMDATSRAHQLSVSAKRQPGNPIVVQLLLSSNEKIVGSIRYQRGEDRFRARLDYLIRRDPPACLKGSGARMPLQVGLTGRVERVKLRRSPADWIGIELPVVMGLESPSRHTRVQVQMSPNLNLASRHPVLGIEGWIGFLTRF